MTDDELRALERAANEGGSVERLRYARALERAGRQDDAWRALAAGVIDPLVRREAARAPCPRGVVAAASPGGAVVRFEQS